MRRIIVTALVLALTGGATAWETPVNLGEAINTEYNEWYPSLALDGSFMLFVSDRPDGMGGMDIWISYWNGTDWNAAENLGPNVNTAYDDSAPYLAENDTVLYFLSTDPSGFGQGDVWYCDISGGTAGPKTNLGQPVNGPHYDCCPVLAHSGERLYICSDRPGGSGSIDIWISDRIGDEWQEPYNAGTAVNTAGTDCPRWISDNDEVLLAVSNGPGGYGSADLYTVTTEGDTLGGRTNLGPVINTVYIELGAGFLANAGTVGGTIYFGSGRVGGFGQRDIWSSNDSGSLEVLTWAGIKGSYSPEGIDGACRFDLLQMNGAASMPTTRMIPPAL